MRIVLILLLTVSAFFMSACSVFPHKNASWNEKAERQPKPSKASFDVHDRGKFRDTLFVIASSGGGSRAAIFSANVFLRLQDISVDNGQAKSNLLAEVDAISAVSGSTLPTAYYAIATAEGEICQDGDDASARQHWNAEEVRRRMAKNFQLQWLGRWFLPQNIVRFWFTSYDRSDIMAQVFANTLYDRKFKLGTYTFGEICDDRPNIILNATNGSSSKWKDDAGNGCSGDRAGKGFGSLFTFTDCEFRKLGSSINTYPIANAVMSSSAFPAAFHYTTLRNFARQDQQKLRNAYVHLFDGGSNDNLGLESAWHLIDTNKSKFKRVVVLLIDSFVRPKGVDETSPEARTGFDYLVDTNFFDSVDSLLAKNRRSLILDFENRLEKLESSDNLKTFFYHLTFDSIEDPELKAKVDSIRTRFKSDRDEAKSLQDAAETLLSANEDCLGSLKGMVAGLDVPAARCGWNRTVEE